MTTNETINEELKQETIETSEEEELPEVVEISEEKAAELLESKKDEAKKLLVYLSTPIDLIPDFIPVIGFLDDAALVTICVKYLVADDIREFKEWREENVKED